MPRYPSNRCGTVRSLLLRKSKFIYDERPLDPIDLRAVGIADRMGADITEFRLTTPIGTSSLSGRLTDWASLKYDLNIESTVDLTQASSIFPLGTPIAGIGNFKGTVSGSGESYRVEGAIDSLISPQKAFI